MSTKIEAREVCGSHIGKTVSVPEEDFVGRLVVVEHIVGGVALILDVDDPRRHGHQLNLRPTDLVTIDGATS